MNENEMLWRKFSPSEVNETHLKCSNIEVFGNFNENRFIKKGEITYKRLYTENLYEGLINKLFRGRILNEFVTLYKREFYGIDKNCDEKFNLIDDFNDLNKIRKIDKIIEIVEGFALAIISFLILIDEIHSHRHSIKRNISQNFYCMIYLIYIILVCGALAFHTIAYIKLIKFNNINYNCSDEITNEIIKKGNEYNKKLLLYNIFSFYIDAVIIAGNFLGFIIGLIWHLIDKCKDESKPNEYQSVDNINNSQANETAYYEKYQSDT